MNKTSPTRKITREEPRTARLSHSVRRRSSNRGKHTPEKNLPGIRRWNRSLLETEIAELRFAVRPSR
jgi:hypothetical protein